MRTETKNFVVDNGYDLFVISYENIGEVVRRRIMPSIASVSVIKDVVVIVEFFDGTSEKSTLSASDTFSLEQGISICVTKKLLSMLCNGHGSSIYNKIIKRGVKVFNEMQKIESERVVAEENAKKKKIKEAERRKAKKQKRDYDERERLIEIQKEAYLRAMEEICCVDSIKKCNE